jgi:hypothetical protein
MFETFIKFKDEEKLIIWFMQPHWPFIDGYDDILKDEVYEWVKQIDRIGDEEISAWWALRHGFITIDRVKEAYRKCLKTVMPYTQEIARRRHKYGKVIITSDHGNLYQCPFGHNMGLKELDVRLIPWFEVKQE